MAAGPRTFSRQEQDTHRKASARLGMSLHALSHAPVGDSLRWDDWIALAKLYGQAKDAMDALILRLEQIEKTYPEGMAEEISAGKRIGSITPGGRFEPVEKEMEQRYREEENES